MTDITRWNGRRSNGVYARDIAARGGRKSVALATGLALLIAGCGSQGATKQPPRRTSATHKPGGSEASTNAAASGTSSAQSDWVALHGFEVSYRNSAILTQDPNGQNSQDYFVYGTTSAINGAVIDPSKGLPAQTAIEDSEGNPVESAIVSGPQAAHPAGVVYAVVQATNAAQGLTAPSTDWYLSSLTLRPRPPADCQDHGRSVQL
jgi:hypothetical protein